jgi:hypothetical protein
MAFRRRNLEAERSGSERQRRERGKHGSSLSIVSREGAVVVGFSLWGIQRLERFACVCCQVGRNQSITQPQLLLDCRGPRMVSSADA